MEEYKGLTPEQIDEFNILMEKPNAYDLNMLVELNGLQVQAMEDTESILMRQMGMLQNLLNKSEFDCAIKEVRRFTSRLQRLHKKHLLTDVGTNYMIAMLSITHIHTLLETKRKKS